MNIIAIDCGASFIKACLFDDKGSIKKEFVSTAPKPIKNEDEVFLLKQAPELIKIVENAIDSFVPECEGTIGISISNEMHGFLLCKENGDLFCDYISWQKEFGKIDTTCGKSVEALKNNCISEIEKSGMPLRAGLPSANLLYLKFSGKLNYSGTLKFYTLGDYIIQKLSRKSVICHPTNAAATGLYDLANGEWNWKLISYVTNRNVEFPVIGDGIFGFEHKGREFVAVPAIGDYQAAMLGAGVENEKTLSFNLATGAQVSCLLSDITDKEVKDSSSQLVPYFDNKYLKRIAFIPSGRAINVYIRFIKDLCRTFDAEIKDEKIWNYIVKHLDANKDGSMLFDLSFFENPLTSNVNGSIENIGEYTLSFDDFIDSIFSSLVNGYLICADKIFPDKDEIKEIIMTGGLVRRIGYIQSKIKRHYGTGKMYKVGANETLNGNRIHLLKCMDNECRKQNH